MISGVECDAVELRHLRYFTAVAENGGFGRAARILHVAQSAISEQIRDLESELGVALFDRKNRRIRLTYHGEQFLKDARAVLAAADRAAANVQKSHSRRDRNADHRLFCRRNRDTSFPASSRNSAIAFRRCSLPGGDGAWHAAPRIGNRSHRYRVHAARATGLRNASPLGALSRRNRSMPCCPRVIRWQQSAGSSFVNWPSELFILNDRSHSPATFDKVITLCAEAGFSPRIGSTATVALGVIALVEAGEGMAILPEGSQELEQR